VKDDPVASYRNYYRLGKTHLHKWTKRQPPEWLGLLNRGENEVHI